MNFEMAAKMSRQGAAVRVTMDGRIIRRDRTGNAVEYASGAMRPADPSDLHGFTDWATLDTMLGASGIPERLRGKGGIAIVREMKKRLDPAEGTGDRREVSEAYLYALEHLVEYATVYFLNLSNPLIEVEIRKGVSLEHAAQWLDEVDQFL